MQSLRFFTNAEVASTLAYPQLIEALRQGLAKLGRHEAVEAVQDLGAVERDRGDALVQAAEDVLEWHRVIERGVAGVAHDDGSVWSDRES